jgi:hypothetical protein
VTWGIYARSDHPPGYGYAPRDGEHGGRAHGYVLLAVESPNGEPLPQNIYRAPVGRLWHEQRDQPDGWDEWYGGDFDLVLRMENRPEIHHPNGVAGQGPRGKSIGDNRAVLLTDLRQLREFGAEDIWGIRAGTGERVSVGLRFR